MFQQSRFLALVSNYDEYVRTLQIAEDSEGQGAIQYLKTMDSISTKIQELKTAWQQLYASLGIEKVIKGILDTITKVLKQLSSYNLSGLIASLIQNFITLKKVFKLVFNSGEKQLNTFVEYWNSKKRDMETPIKITLDTSQAEQQADALAARIANAKEGRTTTNAAPATSAATANGQYYAKVLKESKSLQSLVGSNYSFISDINKGDQILLTKQQANEMTQLWQKYTKNGGTSIEGFISSLEQDSQEVSETLSGFAKAKQWISIPKNLSAVAAGAQILGSTLQAASLALNPKSSDNYEGNKIMSGIGSLIQGGGTGASIGMAFGPLGAAIGAISGVLLSGLTGAFNTIVDGFTVDYAERRKMLEEEAVELTSTQTQKKGEESSLKNAIQTYEELAEKQYDSAEAAEELQEHMNTMAEQYPQLVEHYDEAGNAIIDVQKAEEALAKARYQTATATTEVLKNEVQQKQNDLDELKEIQEIFNNDSVNSYYTKTYTKAQEKSGWFSWEEIDDSAYENFLGDYKNVIGEYTNVGAFLTDLSSGAIRKKFSNDEEYFNFLKNYEDAGLLNAYSTENYVSGWNDFLLSYKKNPDIYLSGSLAEQFLESAKETDFNLDTYNLDSPEELTKAVIEFNEYLNAFINETEDVFSSSSDLLASNLVKEKVSLLAISDTNINEAYEEYSSLMGSVGLEIIKNTLGNIDLTEAQNENSDNYGDYLNAVETATNAVVKLDTEMWEAYADVYSDFNFALSANEIEEKLTNKGITDSNIINAAKNQYTSQTENDKERAKNALANSKITGLRNLFNGENTNKELATAYVDKFISWINTINDYTEQGLTIQAEALQDSGTEMFKQIASLSSNGQEQLFNIVSKIDWTDASTLDTAIEAFEDLDTSNWDSEQTSYLKNALESLQNARNNLLFNLETEINLVTDAYKAAVEDSDKVQKYAENGMSWDEAQEQYTKLKASGDYEDLTPDAFMKYDAATGKYLFTQAGLADVLEYQAKKIEKEAKIAEEQYQLLAKYKESNPLEGISWDNGLEIDDNVDSKWANQIQHYYADWINLDEATRVNFDVYVKTAIAEQTAHYESEKELWDAYDAGYSKLIANNNLELSQIEALQKHRKTAIDYSSKSSLSAQELKEYADMLGVDAVDYILSLMGSAVNFNQSTQSYDVIDFDAYWDALESGLSKNTDAYLEARASWASNRISQEEKKAEAIVGEIDKIFGSTTGDLIDLTYLENLGIAVDGLTSLGNGLYKIGDIDYNSLISQIETQGADELGNSLIEVKDKIISLFNDWAKLLDNGLSGTLSFEGADTLKQQFGLEDADFTQTAEGLKISANAAYKLVAQISKIDSNAGQIATAKMAENLSKANDEYDDIFSVMRKIAKIEEEISNSPSEERLDLLEAELAVAKEIEKTLKEADNTFNFMDRDLPSGFDDPMSAWEGVGDAMKVINDDDWSKGRVGLEDFYNMIDFMGDEILSSGEYFQGQSITAADLIQKGFDAISMIDGEAYVDLSKLGDSFKLGSADMKEGIVAGMKNVAKSQVEMLDAAISILETVVAIQSLDLEGDGLDFGDIFVGNTEYFTEGWSTGIKTVVDNLEKAGIDAESVEIANHTLKDWLTKDLSKLNETREHYLEVMQFIYNWGNGDFDPNAAPEEILASLARQMQGLEEFTYTLGNQKITLDKQGGTMIEEKDENGKIEYSYTIGGKTVSSNDLTEFQSQKEQAQIDYVAEKVIGEDYETKVEEGSKLIINEDPDVEIVIETDKNGKTIGYWYKQQKYESRVEVDDVIAAEQAQAEKLSNAGIQATGETITIGEKVYTQYQFTTGETTYVDENGKQINNEDLKRLSLQEAGFTGATNVPIEANLEITSLDSISFAEDVIPEEGIPFEGSIRITPTSVEIGATNYTVDFLNENGQAVQSIAITGEAQLAAVISGAKIEGDEWVLPDMSADLNLSISEEAQEKIRAFFDEIIQKFQNIPVSFNTSGGTSSSSGTTSSSSNSSSGGGGGSIQTKNNMVPMSYTNSISQMISNIQTYVENLKGANSSLAKETQGITNLNNAATALKNVPSSGATKINAVSSAIGRLPSSKTISVQLQINLSTLGAKMVTVSGGNVNTNGKTANVPLATAKGNAALSKGTLMGELGPELVVSNGHYFTVGENGAEFVNLADDAIVFNHLQTKKLLGSGSTGRGTPVTNEKKATAFASGNAMADAATALAELKQIRAMWKALLDADSATLGKKAGSGGSGGGGSNKETGPVEYDLERWYNLLRQISKLEQQITYEQAKRENMQSGYKYVDSLEKELGLLEKQLKAEKELASLQYDYYLKRMEDVNKGVYSKIFTYDSEGLMQYVDGENRGLDALAKLQATDENGVLKMTAKEQLNYITNTLGVDINDLKYKSNGTEAKEDKDKVQVFFDNVDSIMDELDELYDSYHEHAEKIEDLTSSQNEILQEYVDNQRSLEDKLLQAIEDREQAVIDKLTDEKEAIENASQEYINGLNDALNKEQELYNKNETDTETAKLQRRLAILQRSGGSASEIKSLQDQIDSRLKDAYFQAQQDQIEAIQEASNKQLEKLQDQIDLMTETLEYQKENGLLWQEVYEMLNDWTPEKMLQFIEQYTKTYKENSSLENEETSKDTLKEAEIYAAKRDKDARDTAWSNYYNNANYSDTIKKANADKAQEAFNSAYASGGLTAGEIAANKVFSDAATSQEGDSNAATSSPSATETEPDVKVKGKGTVKTKGSNLNVRKGPGTKYSIMGKYKNKASVILTGYKNGWYQVDYNGKTGYVSGNYISTSDKKNLPAFAEGGLVNFTGPAWVDGTKSKPEAFLSAEDTAMLKSKIFSNNDGSLKTLVAALEDITNKTSSYQGESGGNIVIENATVNIQPGTISNDYDARRAGELALEEMVKIARKTTNRTIRR